MFEHRKNVNINILGKITLLLGSNILLLAGAGLTTAMPAMKREFQTMPAVQFWVSMIVMLPALFVVIGGPVVGYLTDRLGRKPVLVMSMLVGGISGSAAYFLKSITAILAMRALVGLSTAGAMTATNSLIADYFEGQERVKFMGLLSAIMGLSGVVFLPVGGFLADIEWRLAFLAYLPVIVLFPLTLLFIHEPKGLLQDVEDIEAKKIKFSPTILYILAAVFLCQFTILSLPVFSAYFLEDLLGANSMTLGWVGSAFGLLSFLGGYFYERLSRRIPYREMTLAMCLLTGAGFLIFAIAGGWLLVMLGELIIGYSMGLINSNLPMWLADEVSQHVRGRANGIFVTMMFLGQFTTSLIFTPIINAGGYRSGYIFAAGVILLTGLAALLIKRKPKVPEEAI
jgi:MFS family permease